MRTLISDKVYDLLRKKRIALKKQQICKQLCLKKSSVDKACTQLRKEGFIGNERVYYGKFGDMKIFSYWGIR